MQLCITCLDVFHHPPTIGMANITSLYAELKAGELCCTDTPYPWSVGVSDTPTLRHGARHAVDTLTSSDTSFRHATSARLSHHLFSPSTTHSSRSPVTSRRRQLPSPVSSRQSPSLVAIASRQSPVAVASLCHC
ncbi:hypothetical protein ACLB2K_073049 [Fragaria x ananassa]